uniref:Protein STRUBBELIG-RECEPTOR FAMILY 3 n=1 Tax=Anthurium amnicola TaxID=1678845 RepID=A0A1D1XHP7_9ARAE
MFYTSLEIFFHLLVGLMMIFGIPVSWGYTYEQDVYAINNLYASLGSPSLPGWIPNGGDPCLEGWQGVECVGPNITAIILNGANLEGELGDKLANFSSIITIDLSNNHIAGSIPENLPVTMQRFFISDNEFTGSIPSSLSQLTSLTDMSLNNNGLTGALPDAFQLLTGLINLDLSFNNLSSQLPPSMEGLPSLTTLHIQNNQLSGTLDVLQDLPLKDLNVENNLFSGPIPTKLYNIPNFKSDGNPFNTTIAPASPSPSPPVGGAPDSSAAPLNPASGPSVQDNKPPNTKKKLSTQRIVGLAFAVAIAVIIFILALMLVANYCLSKHRERKSDHEHILKRQELGPYVRPRVENRSSDYPTPPSTDLSNHETKKVPKEAAAKQHEEHDIDKMSIVLVPSVENVVVAPSDPVEKSRTPSPEKLDSPTSAVKLNPPTSVVSFSVGSLQQYTDSFSEDNVIRDSRLGRVYLAKLADGKQLVIMKLDNANNALPVDEFLELILGIFELRHPNIVELMGYCAEYGQRLLAYNYFSRRTLHDTLHSRDDLKRKLSWNARIQVALGAARALEYLHEFCQPPVVYQNFESSNILLDDKIAVRVCDCGLAPLLSSNSVTQLSGRIHSFSYEAPEINDSWSYTEHSDVYSFGVVMLELLTGRKPYDSSRPRAEQYLVRWASSQFHDIDMLSKMVDPSIEGKYPVKSLSRFADIISRCIQHSPEFRPLMSEVVQDLKRMVDELNGEPT